MEKSKWVWMPHSGHFIAGSMCGFKLNTYIGGYIVSTVGEYVPRGGFDYYNIGAERFYESMVFKAVHSKNACCPYEMSDPQHVDFMGYMTADEAYKGHFDLCKRWSSKKRS